MATHLVSFRIEADASYSTRWSSTVEAIRKEAKGDRTWEETSSLIIIESDMTPDALASSIYVSSTFDSTKDKLLVVDVTHNRHATRGKIDYPNLLGSFFRRNALGLLAG